ncbi:hypothetical protein AcW1_000138 [Taiwanofungus camphoratus]|nr:hypothetical protein AcW2_010277 [Antrodia cinnamomea]KAI0962905.1 hypothetical protein AcW1_000138 [Antrodia cinnamomea]
MASSSVSQPSQSHRLSPSSKLRRPPSPGASSTPDRLNSPNTASVPVASSLHADQASPGRYRATEVVESDKGWTEENYEVEQQATPRKSSPYHLGLLPPFGTNQTSHLPTPQSPSNVGSYSAAFDSPLQSPIPYGSHNLRSSALQLMPHNLPRSEDRAASVSFMTPESSPLFPRKSARSHFDTNSAAGPSSSPLSSPFTPRPRSQTSETEYVKTETAGSPIGKAPTVSFAPSSRVITPSARLSSPFMDRLSLADHPSTLTRTPIRARPGSPGDRTSPGPVHLDDIFSPDASSSKTPPPLSAPVPQRAVGGEIQRIHLQLAADHAARLHEMEARRPDYLVREKRPDSGADSEIIDQPNQDDQENLLPGLGVTVSPIKGRRLKLFQETSEESFEQSLLAGGYPGYGSTNTSGDPQTPINKGKASLSQRAMQWLHHATPGQPGPANTASELEADWIPSDKEIRKRKRLAAFQDNTSASEPPMKLYPVEIEGKGRVLLNVSPEEIATQIDSPVRKRGYRRKKRGTVLNSPTKKGHVDEALSDDTAVTQPNWVDSAFPWCMRSQERNEMARLEQEERLRHIERYLERDSDSDEDIGESQTLNPAVLSHDDDVPPPRKGRGKMVPLRANPNVRSKTISENVLLPSDPADARAALLSKRSVRALASRRKRGKEDDEGSLDGEVVCVCHRGDDGRPLVQCDDCKTWYHLSCVGIKNASELGDEDDPWYCADCLGVPMASSNPALEPTFVPTDDRPPVDGVRDPLFFNASLQESPAAPWSSSRLPRTPLRGRNLPQDFSSRSSWEDSSRLGPSTPVSSAQSVRVYSSPGPYGNAYHDESPFDPTITPSRGIKFGTAITTPKQGIWSTRANGQSQTPHAPGRESWKHSGGSFAFPALNDSNGPSLSPYRSIYSYDDTPVRRSRPREESRILVGRRLWDSPLPPRHIPLHESSTMVVDSEREQFASDRDRGSARASVTVREDEGVSSSRE